MSAHTGGHYLDTGDGPKPLTVAAVASAGEHNAQAAYRAYLDHRPGCEQCQTSLFICETGKTLWDAYREARGRSL